jgi:mannosyltransferase
MVVGGLTFLPWLPVLAYQSAHTGAPWAPAPDLTAVLTTVDAWMGGGASAARFSALFALGLVVLAVAGRRAGRKEMLVGGRLSWVPLRVLAVVLGTLFLAIVVDMADGEAYAPRYLATGSALFLLVVAFGIVVLPSERARRGALALLAVAGLGVATTNAAQLRTQAGQVAAVLNEQAKPGDVVVYCPDQMGPSVSRLLHVSSRQVVYPDLASPHSVDWVDYRSRNLDADPGAFARTVQRLAGSHRIWLVYTLQVTPLARTCAEVIDQFVAMRGLPAQPVTRHPGQGETMALHRYDARR